MKRPHERKDHVENRNHCREHAPEPQVATIAPEVAGRIVRLPVVDNQLVRRGDLLMEIDPTDYAIALRLAEATLDQARVDADNAQREAMRRRRFRDRRSASNGGRSSIPVPSLRRRAAARRWRASTGCVSIWSGRRSAHRSTDG